MKCRVQEGNLIIDLDGQSYSFEAHGEAPRPSALGWGLSVAGKHWSNRDPDIVLEKHISVQNVTVGNGMIAWYTQEFLPDGIDYKMSKNAKVYLGFLETGEQRLIYKGECYGDLCFDKTDLYINIGNKIAVIDLTTNEMTVLFKHSGLKKNGVALQVTPERIFFTHWTKDNNYMMWYDRRTKEVVNPHINTYDYFPVGENSLLFQSLYHAWELDMNTMKKKRVVSNKTIKKALDLICEFLEIPTSYYEHDYTDNFELVSFKDNRPHFVYWRVYRSPNGLWSDECVQECLGLNLPFDIYVEVSTDRKGNDLRLEVDKGDIVRRESKKIKDRWAWYAMDEELLLKSRYEHLR